MSRIAKKPIIIPKGVDVNINAQIISAKGPKGQLTYKMHNYISIEREEDSLTVVPSSSDKNTGEKPDKLAMGALLGTTRSNINNLMQGVFQGYERKLLLVGVGYRAQVQGKNLNLSLGFSHPVVVELPEGVVVEVPVPTEIIVKGPDKQLVGQTAANIRAIRPVEPYKGKGVRYSDERVSLKETKKK